MSESYDDVSDDELVARYRSTLVEAVRAGLSDESVHALIEQSINIVTALQSRESLSKLLPLLDDTNSNVRLGAAFNCLPLARQKCIAALQSLAHDRNPFVAAEAGLYLIREGIAIEPKSKMT
jgi:hypothetical protein